MSFVRWFGAVGCITLIGSESGSDSTPIGFQAFQSVAESTDICQAADIVGYEFGVFLSLSWQSGGREELRI